MWRGLTCGSQRSGGIEPRTLGNVRSTFRSKETPVKLLLLIVVIVLVVAFVVPALRRGGRGRDL